MQSMDELLMEAQNLFSNSPQQVKDLTHQFFQSMDTNNNGRVDFQEFQSFFQNGNFRIQPRHQRNLFMELDQDYDNTLNFNEFITFFYLVFLRAYCNHCGKSLLGKKRRTCLECFMSETPNGSVHTYDICRTCYYTFRYSHHHRRNQLKKFEEVIFCGNVPGPMCGNYGTSSLGTESRHDIFRRLYCTLQTAAAVATITTAAVAGVTVLAGCTIM